MKIGTLAVLLLGSLSFLGGCDQQQTKPAAPTIPSRESALPSSAVKINPKDDPHPPLLHHSDWSTPIPLPGPVNTAGGEDAPFIPDDGRSLYFFFTPDLTRPVQDQLHDGVTGIYRSLKTEEGWGRPQRVILSEDIALDGCPFARGGRLWFCSARPGTAGVGWFTADLISGSWQNWRPVKFKPDYQVGEFHLSPDETELYFGSDRPGSIGGSDLWLSLLDEGQWSQPIHLTAVNTTADESRPFLTADGKELWFTRTYRGTPAVFRSQRTNGSWGTPELILSQFAGEPTLDRQGNIYFVHHYYQDGKMIEVDIYLAKKK